MSLCAVRRLRQGQHVQGGPGRIHNGIYTVRLLGLGTSDGSLTGVPSIPSIGIYYRILFVLVLSRTSRSAVIP